MVELRHPATLIGRETMRRIIIPLVFVALLTIAAVVPVAAEGGDSDGKHTGGGCEYEA